MKKTLAALITLAILGAPAFCGAETSTNTAAIKSAVIKRFVARTLATVTNVYFLDKKTVEPTRVKELDGRLFSRALNRISVADCPADFQAVWNIYVAAWGERAKQKSFLVAAAAAMETKGISIAKDLLADYAKTQATVRAWEDCYDVAFRHGLEIPPDPPL